MTATQCAAILDCSIAAWSQYEKGKRDPGLESIPAICKMFNISSDELFGLDRGSSAAVVVNGSGNAVANGAHASATVARGKSATPGETPNCRKCPCKQLYDAVQKAQKSLSK